MMMKRIAEKQRIDGGSSRIVACTVAALALLSAATAWGQRQAPPSLDEYYTYGDNYFLEVTTLPGAAPPKERAVVSFRLTYDLLNFRKQGTGESAVYIATPSMFVEAAGSDGVISAREIWRDTVRTSDYALTNSRTMFVCGAVELAVRPDLYTLKYAFADGGPESGFEQTTGPIKVDDFHSPSPAIGSPIFLKSFEEGRMTAAATDGNALFGLPFRAFIPLAGPEPPTELRYSLVTMVKNKPSTAPPLLSGNASILGAVAPGSPIPSGNDILFPTLRDSSVPSGSYGALIDASADRLEVGDYMLVLTYQAGVKSVVDSVPFKLRWIDMPLSLIRPEYAIRALYPIAKEDTVDELLSGGSEKRQGALNRYWERLDPTPGTKYNEKMTEYYRRVDYSYFNFKSIEQRDGVFTDRGKIYILFGPPTSVEREMHPEAPPREIWEYRNKVNRKFVFVDKSETGAFRLVEYHDL